MNRNHTLLQHIIDNQRVLDYRYRTVLDHDDFYCPPKTVSFDPEQFEKDLFNNTLIDGLKLRMRYCTLTINMRNGY